MTPKTLLFILLFLPVFALAQDKTAPIQYLYAEIIGTNRTLSAKVDVQIDYGQKSKLLGDYNRIVDPETGKPIIFNSMVDAMNFMAEMGWSFVQAYSINGNDNSISHWIIKRELSVDEPNTFLPATRGDLYKPTK